MKLSHEGIALSVLMAGVVEPVISCRAVVAIVALILGYHRAGSKWLRYSQPDWISTRLRSLGEGVHSQPGKPGEDGTAGWVCQEEGAWQEEWEEERVRWEEITYTCTHHMGANSRDR